MKRLILLTIILTAGAVTGRIAAQDAASVSKRANQQYVLFESERDKGTNITAMYDYLLESYVNFIKIVEAPDNGQYLEGAKNRLRSLYPVEWCSVLLGAETTGKGVGLCIGLYRYAPVGDIP